MMQNIVTETPNASQHAELAPLAARYVDIAALPWEPTRFDGIEVKTLMRDTERGLLTTLVRMASGAVLPDHEHLDIEQTFVLEGSLVDGEGAVDAGNYVWRPPGSRHTAHAPRGALLFSVFLQPNRFFDQATRGFDDAAQS